MSKWGRGDEIIAYDYDAQRWITGGAAAELLERQSRETAELLAEDSGFAEFIGLKNVDGDDNG